MDIEKPTLILDKKRAIRNIEKMAEKAKKSGVRFRPHFKTHQSAQIGDWFKNFGISAITVSSVDMAVYFAEHDWKDITIAFPVNFRQIKKINELTKKIQLNLLVESKEAIHFLGENLLSNTNIWINIDVGYHRTGILWNNFTEVQTLAKEIEKLDNLSLSGLLTHSGHSYKAKAKDEIREIYFDTVSKMKSLQENLLSKGLSNIEISVGDTPTCSLIEDFSDVDEIRPGNFVFYDVKQLSLGSCREEDIAIAMACPIVAKYLEKSEIVIYCGAIHLSKDFILKKDGKKFFGDFGKISLPTKEGWGSTIRNASISSLSQEHGIVKAEKDFVEKVQIGDILFVLPIHSCLTANLMKKYHTFEGKEINKFSYGSRSFGKMPGTKSN